MVAGVVEIVSRFEAQLNLTGKKSDSPPPTDHLGSNGKSYAFRDL